MATKVTCDHSVTPTVCDTVGFSSTCGSGDNTQPQQLQSEWWQGTSSESEVMQWMQDLIGEEVKRQECDEWAAKGWGESLRCVKSANSDLPYNARKEEPKHGNSGAGVPR